MSSPATTPEQETETSEQLRHAPRYQVILLDDDDHSFEYVIFMMRRVFGHPEAKGEDIAKTVHRTGRALCFTGSLEQAELKRDQIHGFGPDPLIPRCRGSMSAEIEALDD